MILDIHCEDPGWKHVAQLKKLTHRAIAAALPDANVSLSVLYSSDAHVRELNARWRGRDYATNILSFPVGTAPRVPEGEARPLGDLILAYGVVAREAAEQGKAVTNHLAHLLVHGTLHLLGYDHETDHDAEIMEGLETTILASLGISDPYAITDTPS
jgi:probable rRNA maturation factor